MNVQPDDYNRDSETGQTRAALATDPPLGPQFERLALEFGVTPAQSGPWNELVAALEIDARLLSVRSTTAPCDLDQVFGALEQRFTKLSMM